MFHRSSSRLLFGPSLLILRGSFANQTPQSTRFAAQKSFGSSPSQRTMSTVPSSYQAWLVEQKEDGSFAGSETTLSTDALPIFDDDNNVLIQVTHSSLNYKDALSAKGPKGGVTRRFPHTPGIDAAGTNLETGEAVLVTGYDLGMNTPGGFGEHVRVPKAWVLPSPFPDPKTAMIYGTAGLTAGLCVEKLLQMGATPAQGKVCVTGASGAVGSVAVELLTKLGFEVVAVSGKAPETLKDLGAQEIIGRDALAATKKPMLKPIYANAIDTVGGAPLAELLKLIKPGGSVSCCGLVAGMHLETTVLPFILRGINLLGVDSVEIPLEAKEQVWKNLATSWACPKTEATARTIGRHELDSHLKAFLKGESTGKIVLDHSLTAATSSS